MTVRDRIKTACDSLQDYAASYFETIHKASFNFWDLPTLPSGADVLNGVFAIVLITMARGQMSQPTDASITAKIILSVLFFTLLLCGILIVFDKALAQGGQTQRLSAWRKLVAVVSITITLGCAFIVLDRILPWIGPIFSVSSGFNFSTDAANGSVASVAAFLACTVILANTLFRGTPKPFVLGTRLVAWTMAIFGMVTIGINILVAGTVLAF